MKLHKEEKLLANGFNQFNLVDENNFDIKDFAGKPVYYPIADIWNTKKAKRAAINKAASEAAFSEALGD